MHLKSIEYNWATFFKHYIVCPGEAPTKEQRKMARIASIVVGILTLGIAQLIVITRFKNYRYTIRDRNDRTLVPLYVQHPDLQDLLVKRAERGDRVAAFKVYERLYQPPEEGTSFQDVQARPWYTWLQKSAESDYGPALKAIIDVMMQHVEASSQKRKLIRSCEKALEAHPDQQRKLGRTILQTDIPHGLRLLKLAARGGDLKAMGSIGHYYEQEATAETDTDKREQLLNTAAKWYEKGAENVSTLRHILRITQVNGLLKTKFQQLANAGNETFAAVLCYQHLAEVNHFVPENPNWKRLSTLVSEGNLLASYFLAQTCITMGVPEMVEVSIAPLLKSGQVDLCRKVITFLQGAQHEKLPKFLKQLIKENPYQGEYLHHLALYYHARWRTCHAADAKLQWAEKAIRYALRGLKLPCSVKVFNESVGKIGAIFQEHPNLLQYLTKKDDLKLLYRIALTQPAFENSRSLIAGLLGLKYAESKNREKLERAKLYLEQGGTVARNSHTDSWLDKFEEKLGSLTATL